MSPAGNPVRPGGDQARVAELVRLCLAANENAVNNHWRGTPMATTSQRIDFEEDDI